MGLLKRFFNQTRKPEGILGALMLQGMNSGHGELADWGFTHLPPLRPAQIVDLGCGAGRNAGEMLKKYPYAHVTAIDYSPLSVEKAASYNKKSIDAGRCTVLQGDVSDLRLERRVSSSPRPLKPSISGPVWNGVLSRLRMCSSREGFS